MLYCVEEDRKHYGECWNEYENENENACIRKRTKGVDLILNGALSYHWNSQNGGFHWVQIRSGVCSIFVYGPLQFILQIPYPIQVKFKYLTL